MATYSIRNIRLLDAIHEIENGEIQLPDFQRPYVWREAGQKSLLDSLQKGYPVGALLLLETEGSDGASGPFGAKLVEKVASKPADEMKTLKWLVLDGQQRLTTTFQAFSLTSETPKWFFLKLRDLYKAVRENKPVDMATFLVKKAKPLMPEAMLYSHDLLPLPFISRGRQPLRENLHSYYTNLLAASDEADYANFISLELENYLEQIFAYEFPCVVLPASLDLEAVANVFTTLNTRGVSLGAFDLCVSALFPQGVRLRDKWDEIKDRSSLKLLDKDGTAMLQTVALMAGESVKKSKLVSNISEFHINAHWDRAANGFDEAHTKLQLAGALSTKSLPYDTMGPALVAALLNMNPARSPHEIAALQDKVTRWVMQTAFTKRYTEGSDNKKEEDYKEALVWFNGGAVPSFLEPFTYHENSSFKMETKGARYSAFIAILNTMKPNDFIKSMESLNEKVAELHHIFPKAWLKENGFEPKSADVMLNITFLTPESNNFISDDAPSVYLSRLIRKWMEDNPALSEAAALHKLTELLRLHLISEESINALMADDYEGFLRSRGKTLIKKLETSNVEVAFVADEPEDDEEDEEDDSE